MSFMDSFTYAIIAALIWGVVPIIEKLGLGKMDPVVGLFYRCIGVLLGLVLLSIFVVKPEQIKSVHLKSAVFLMAGGFLASFAAQIFFYTGLKHGDVSKMVPISGSYPLISFILGVLLLGEGISLFKIIGVILVTAGIWFLKGG